MTTYHPMAVIRGETAPFDKLFVMEGFRSADEAVNQFTLWEGLGYTLEKAWLQVFEGRVHVEDRIYKKVWQYESTEPKEDKA